ncbi:MAG: CPBP family intramembrane glutamic endopeptidase [Bacteroidota bacterium]
MNRTETTPLAGDARRLIAPVRHTVLLVVVLLAIAAWGVYVQTSGAAKGAAGRGSTLPLYLSLAVLEWGLLRLTWAGLRRGGTSLHDLLGTRWATWKDVVRDVLIAAGGWIAWTALSAAASPIVGEGSAKELGRLLPRGPAEAAAWIVLSLSAGFCEEAVYRGYLQKQFAGLTGSAHAGVLVQAVLFGVSHAYQGAVNVAVITVLGALYGWLAFWRKSLKPGMILHAWMDIFGGLLERSF